MKSLKVQISNGKEMDKICRLSLIRKKKSFLILLQKWRRMTNRGKKRSAKNDDVHLILILL